MMTEFKFCGCTIPLRWASCPDLTLVLCQVKFIFVIVYFYSALYSTDCVKAALQCQTGK